MSNTEKIINDAWENKDQINQNSEELLINAVNQIIEGLNNENLEQLTDEIVTTN